MSRVEARAWYCAALVVGLLATWSLFNIGESQRMTQRCEHAQPIARFDGHYVKGGEWEVCLRWWGRDSAAALLVEPETDEHRAERLAASPEDLTDTLRRLGIGK
ncbi:MAG: hypothetical protein AB7F94_11905 [Nitrospira sp.]